MEFFVQCPGLIFLAARWSGPATSASIFLGCSMLSDRLGRRERKRHSKSCLPSFLPFYFRVCLFSIQRTRLSRSLEQANIFSAFLDYILRVCQSLSDSFFHLGKLHWFLYLLLSYYYDPGMFIPVYLLLQFEFRGKSCVEWEHGGEDGISCLLPCIL